MKNEKPGIIDALTNIDGHIEMGEQKISFSVVNERRGWYEDPTKQVLQVWVGRSRLDVFGNYVHVQRGSDESLTPLPDFFPKEAYALLLKNKKINAWRNGAPVDYRGKVIP